MQQQQNKNDKKPIIAIFALAAICIIGGTFAYFTVSTQLENRFKTQNFNTEIVEEFNSPDNWKPGDVTPKTVSVKNTGEVDVAVRIKYTEEWISKDGTILSGKQTIDDNGTPSEITAAIIKFDNESKWIKNNGYYYYYKKLTTNEIAPSFIKEVEFNKLITSDIECNIVNKIQTCESSGKGYDGAKYTLTIYVETLQFNVYKSVWQTDVEIGE